MKKKNYGEGDWFGVPLKQGGYALGIIARSSHKSPSCLGFFFGSIYVNLPTIEKTQLLQAKNAVLIAWFGDLGLINGAWPIIGPSVKFDKKGWPVPLFKRIDNLDSNRGWLIEYPQDEPIFTQPLRVTPTTASSLNGIINETLHGYKALEIVLSKLL